VQTSIHQQVLEVDLPAVIVQPSSHLLPEDAREGPVDLQYLLVDTGLHGRELSRLVRVGDLVSFAQPPMELAGETLAGHSLDNRASVAALTHCLQELQDRRHLWDVWAVATVQEEETLGGARTSAFELRPELAVAIDVTHGRGPGIPDHKAYPLGKGPALGWGPNIHPGLHQEIELTPSALFLSFMLDQLFHQNIISECRGSKSNYFVCDGYYTTNIAYHCYVNKSLPLKDALSAARIFKMPVPDLVIYIDVPPKLALERKMLEEGHSEGLDVYERSLMFQTQVRQAFKKMAKNSVFGNWAEVDGNRSVDDIRDAIMRILLTRKLIPN